MNQKEIIKLALCKMGIGSNMPDTGSDKKKVIKDIRDKYIKNMGIGDNMPSF